MGPVRKKLMSLLMQVTQFVQYLNHSRTLEGRGNNNSNMINIANK